MIVERSSAFIEEAIIHLYEQVGIDMPSTQQYITPLNDLIDHIPNFDLVCIELPELTEERAMRYLYDQGARVDLPDSPSSEPLAGFLYINTHRGCIFVEQNDPVVRRRFSVAHELGHYVLHFRPLIELYDRDQHYLEMTESFHLTESEDLEVIGDMLTGGSLVVPQQQAVQSLPPFEQMEQEANQFAATLLMPDNVVRVLCARSGGYIQDNELAWRIATETLVSRASAYLRLSSLKLLTSFQGNGSTAKETTRSTNSKRRRN